MSDRVTVTMDGGVADVRLVRADKMNALDGAMFDALIATGDELKTQKGLRAVVLSGEGRAFCAGLDMGSFAQMAGGGHKSVNSGGVGGLGARDYGIANKAQQVCFVWRQIPVPVIAAVHGVALGGGFQLMLGADMRFVAPDTKLSILEIKWGLVPDMTGTVTLRELLPMDQAKLLTMTGRMFSGTEARALNLVTGISADPLAEAEKLVAELRTRSPDAVAATKQLFHETWVAGVRRAFSKESRIQLGLLLGRNQRIATQANFSKQKPEFLPRR